MKISALLAMLAFVVSSWCVPVQAGAFFGAGASFPKPVYLAWGKAYKAQSEDVLIYTAVGSGKGLSEILAAKTDFGASDMPFSAEELAKNGLIQFPAVIGGVVPTFNIKGVADGQLKLDGVTLAAIFLGKIKNWNDPALVALNPGLALPNDPIVLVHRVDKSGATFNLTNYLSKVSTEWRSAQGEGFTITWKSGEEVAGSEAMAQKIASTNGALGYLDYTDLHKRHLDAVKMKNQDGQFVSANVNSFAAAASSAKWSVANGFFEILTNEPGKDSWPITSASFILVERTPTVAENVEATLRYFDWAYRKGDAIAVELGYVPVPDSVADLIRNAWKTQFKSRTGKALWN
ncbi:MAG: phosphate ABC transporter substrate-binding protein PstS [Gallionella sp.]